MLFSETELSNTKISKAIDLNNTVNNLDLMYVCRIKHSTDTEDTFF